MNVESSSFEFLDFSLIQNAVSFFIPFLLGVLSYHLMVAGYGRVSLSKINLPRTKTKTPFIPDSCAVLIGVGPGDPSLLTIAASRCIEESDLIICDRLVSSDILKTIEKLNPNVEYLFSQKCKAKDKADSAQNQLNEWIVDGLKSGKKVCRLKGGDPFLFGRGMEEVSFILSHGFRVKVVPGISSSYAAPLAAGISVTKRDVANRVLVATAHGKHDTVPKLPEFSEDSTLVFLMGVSRLESLMQELINDKGFASNTPVTVIERATTPLQKVVSGIMSTISAVCKDNCVQAPATIIVGKTCTNHELAEGFKSCYPANMGGVIFSNH